MNGSALATWPSGTARAASQMQGEAFLDQITNGDKARTKLGAIGHANRSTGEKPRLSNL
jgi:hypothetical protein